MEVKEQLQQIFDQLTAVLSEELLAGNSRQITKLALARTEIRETLISLEREEAWPNVYRFPQAPAADLLWYRLQLRRRRWQLQSGRVESHPEVLPAALDWLAGEIEQLKS
ncbi:hypothetical protein [Paenibacillus sp. NFR01]|uniref:hypothetical protein n=1 Tax=Paenibacillus sp. NFR01 TaxID=1566279 RepID=UPI0008D478FB|nr:hypothetical protein [Paenibacillus sp. NFR01]SEU32559.1 hypothetical protein SAMN03159358_0137 [Paenibacillus sp. NFR01]